MVTSISMFADYTPREFLRAVRDANMHVVHACLRDLELSPDLQGNGEMDWFRFNESAMDLAVRLGNPEVVGALRATGAMTSAELNLIASVSTNTGALREVITDDERREFWRGVRGLPVLLPEDPVLGYNLLQIAAAIGDLNSVRILAEIHGYNPQHRGVWLNSPIALAAENGHHAVLSYFYDSGAWPDEFQDPLPIALRNGHRALAEEVLRRRGMMPLSLNDYQENIWQAVRRQDIEVLRALLGSPEDPADVNFYGPDGRTPLHRAAYAGRQDIIELLLEHGADINAATASGSGLVDIAFNTHQHDLIIFLWERGIELTAENSELVRTGGNRNLFEFAIRYDLGALARRMMLANPRLIEHRMGRFERTPLMYAAGWGNEEMVRWLISQGANYRTMDREAATPEEIARLTGHTVIAELLTPTRTAEFLVGLAGDGDEPVGAFEGPPVDVTAIPAADLAPAGGAGNGGATALPAPSPDAVSAAVNESHGEAANETSFFPDVPSKLLGFNPKTGAMEMLPVTGAFLAALIYASKGALEPWEKNIR